MTNFNEDPLFVNPAGGDYKLQASTPCNCIGNDTYLPTDVADIDWDNNTSEPTPLDLSRSPRKVVVLDIGAYELAQDPECGGGGPEPIE